MPAGHENSYRPAAKVGATATAMVEPDTAVFGIRFGRRCTSQEACAEDYAVELAKAKAALDGFGLADELEVSGYHAYAHRTAKRGIIDGYEYGSWGTLRVERSQHEVSAIWRALGDSGMAASFGLSFEIDDERAAEDSLIEETISRAQQRRGARAGRLYCPQRNPGHALPARRRYPRFCHV
ncbi:SIMPL domain-containing protein [Thermophilibacter sp.]